MERSVWKAAQFFRTVTEDSGATCRVVEQDIVKAAVDNILNTLILVSSAVKVAGVLATLEDDSLKG